MAEDQEFRCKPSGGEFEALGVILKTSWGVIDCTLELLQWPGAAARGGTDSFCKWPREGGHEK